MAARSLPVLPCHWNPAHNTHAAAQTRSNDRHSNCRSGELIGTVTPSLARIACIWQRSPGAGRSGGAHSFKTGAGSPCFVVVQFKSGKWVRSYRNKPGTMDCKASNALKIQADLLAKS
jgi:hypothetical protein